MKELIEIQQKLAVPKNLYNSYGDYNYRCAEDIIEHLKPILKSLNCFMLMTDRVEQIGGKNYVISNIKLCNGTDSISVEACAAEDQEKKKFSNSQLTGSASSYARKRALEGLFLLDDIKDPDHEEGETGDHIAFNEYNQPTKEQLEKVADMIKYYKGLKKWSLVERLEKLKTENRDFIQRQIDNYEKSRAEESWLYSVLKQMEKRLL